MCLFANGKQHLEQLVATTKTLAMCRPSRHSDEAPMDGGKMAGGASEAGASAPTPPLDWMMQVGSSFCMQVLGTFVQADGGQEALFRHIVQAGWKSCFAKRRCGWPRAMSSSSCRHRTSTSFQI